jgi:hypothetical protein
MAEPSAQPAATTDIRAPPSTNLVCAMRAVRDCALRLAFPIMKQAMQTVVTPAIHTRNHNLTAAPVTGNE